MIPSNLLFLSAQPVDKYFLWQVQVQIENFRKFHISDLMHVLVWYPKSREIELKGWDRLQEKYPEVNFFYYEDKGVNVGLYVSQLRPHIIKEHFRVYDKYFENKVIFYHDADIIFRELPDFVKLCAGDVCWQSNTTGYLDYSYLHRKELQGNIQNLEAIQEMARIGEIDIQTIKSYDGKTGGAQVILKGVDYKFWEDVERMCIDIRKAFYHPILGSINNRYFKSENSGFQSWCADMWALNFSLWKRGIKTDVTPDLDFSWATSSAEEYHRCKIFHNAGATGNEPGVFFKGKWINESPIGKDISASEKSASWFYVQSIKEIKQ